MFTQKCFIRKSTPELVNKLEEMGYNVVSFGVINIFNEKPYLLSDTNGGIYGMYDIEKGCIDCRTNEELFLAIAALRDDSDKFQYFTNGVFWIKCSQLELKHELDNNYEEFCVADFHKATVSELINHFNK